VTDPRTRLVGAGYDVIGERFDDWRDRIVGDPRERWYEELASRLDDRARVLELGCGSGVAETSRLAQRFRVTGVDVSAAQVRRARANVPQASFVHADFTDIELAPGSFDAVCAFYSFNHVPRELLATLFGRIYSWLVRGGLFLLSLGAQDLPDWTGDFLGAPNFFSGYEPETNRRLLREAGFELLLDEVVTFQEPEGEATFHWVLARR
jgi:cyclopropane fatty-acyl-phospholipid synthase-like methyltransferase